MKLNLCIDIDGTITEPYYWLKLANEYFGTSTTPSEITTYEIHQVLNIPREDYLKFYDKYGVVMHAKANLREEAKQVLWELDRQHNIFYVTARETRLKEVTEEWFYKNNLPKGELYILGTHYKVDTARELECDIFIEDRYENAIQLALSGFKVLLIDCDYNRHPLIPGITRVFSWRDIKNKIQEYNRSLEANIEEALRIIRKYTDIDEEGATKIA